MGRIVFTASSGVAGLPVIPGAPTIEIENEEVFTAFVGDTLTAIRSIPTGGASTGTTWQWFRGGVAIPDATGETYVTVQADDLQLITVRQTETNALGSVSKTSTQQVLIGAIAPSITGAPTISGTPTVGQTLIATAAEAAGNPDPATTWQWTNNGADIPGATGSEYTLVSGDNTDTIRVRQIETNAYGTANATSAGVVVGGAAPTIAGAPSVAGAPTVGQTLSATPQTVTGDPTPTRTWQWLRDGVAISGATSDSYLLAAPDDGKTISVRHTETNTYGTVSRTSTGIVIGTPAGESLTVSINVIAPRSAIAPASFGFEAQVAEEIVFTPDSGEAVPSYFDPNYFLATYEWTVSTIETDNHATRIGYSVSDRLMERAREYGQRPQHMFVLPGEHFVYVRVIFPDGRWGTASTTVTVTDPATAYTAAETFVVSPDGNFTNAPVHGGVANRFTSVVAAWQYLQSTYTGSKAQILCNPDVPMLVGPGEWPNGLNDTGVPTEIFIGSWVPGEEVEWRFTDTVDDQGRLFGGEPGGQFIFKVQDIFMHAPFHDCATEDGPLIDRIFADNGLSEVIFNRCRVRGCSAQFSCPNDNGQPEPVGHLLHINDHITEQFADYVALWPRRAGIIAMTGHKCASPPLNALGAQKKDFARINQHNFLRGGAEVVYVAKNFIYVCHSWTGPTVNSPLRMNRNNPPFSRMMVFANICTGSLGRELDDQQGLCNPGLYAFGHNYCIISPLDNQGMTGPAGCFGGDNNLFLVHDTPDKTGSFKWSGRGPGKFSSYRVRTNGDGTTGLHEPLIARSNTIVDLRAAVAGATNGVGSGDVFYIGAGEGAFLSVQEAGTLPHQPNAPTPIIQPLNVASLGWDSLQDAMTCNATRGNVPPMAANLLPGQSTTIPYASFYNLISEAPLSAAQFTDLNRFPERHAFDGGSFDFEDEEDVTIQVDVPEAGKVTVTNNTTYFWAAGDNLRVRFHPAPYNNSGQQIQYSLPTTVNPGESVVVDNPQGYTLATTGHIRLNVGRQFTVSAEAGGVEMTNASQSVWSAGQSPRIRLNLGYSGYQTPSIAHPAGTISLYRPTEAIPEDAGVSDLMRTVVDFEFYPRPGSNHPDAGAGTYSKGYINPS